MESINEWQQAGTYCTIRGYQIFYRSEGQGEPLLLIHGFPTSSWDWHKIWPVLKLKYHVIALDMLGFGFSDKPKDHKYTLFEQADIVEEFLEELGIKACSILSHDYGDTVLQELLARQQHGALHFRISKAIMLNGGLFHKVHKPLMTQKLLNSPLGSLVVQFLNQQRFEKNMRSIFGNKTQPSEEELNQMWQAIDHQDGSQNAHRIIRYMTERKQQAERWSDAVTKATVPLRLINGTADPISGGHLCDYYEHEVPHADVVRLEGIGHYPQLEAPQEVVKNILPFMQ